MSEPASNATASLDFIREMIATDLAEGRNGGQVITRFPPEPNGYLHIGHAKSICLNFGLAQEHAPNARCHLRFDDTNPTKEEVEYVESIKADVKWLGFDWGEHMFFASDYFEKLYLFAEQLISKGLAYVDDQTQEEMRQNRGTLTTPGTRSKFAERSVEENLDLFRRMRKGEFKEGEKVLRAKIDMASQNMHLRDPALYRILHAHHHRTGDAWCIYPMYDYAHPLSDALEGITHSLCTLEFEVHRPLYEWLINNVDGLPGNPYQREFARLNLSYTVMSKRKLLRLVKEGLVGGWDDPRMPTISGMRRRGITPAAIRSFCKTIGLTKFNSLTEIALLEHAIREDLNKVAHRAYGVLRPIKVVIENYPEDKVEYFEAANHPEDPAAGTRQVPLCREVYIDADDFMEVPVDGFHRLKPGGEVRLKFAFCIICKEVVKDAAGNITELRCTYDEATRHGVKPEGRPKPKGIIHWVSARHAIDATVRLYDRLFTVATPDADAGEDGDFTQFLNQNSLEVLTNAKLEPSLKEAAPGSHWQFERVAYFYADPIDSQPGAPVFNRTVTLKDGWAPAKK
ncbi:MAG: glutamine--tRNA ligase/YqeY domain fusion protein [Prosthecobacter sp.]|jgi:glutaminyl-tRNA synthetase|uniref:glutamine--tRNA ligase/YqeY domain fusion protein n=1 Tax=Prosthecobacter sp. TaxID=1965333 RepID=UPI0019E544E2|nr:glutamine--tRNA ligase/YqeY domain fusion protein [Prosthecobacter sp.]MBE2282971.1 glutamine--tRNA ligase/YqeY domain fusion protein [Prosthecobacter sp.]